MFAARDLLVAGRYHERRIPRSLRADRRVGCEADIQRGMKIGAFALATEEMMSVFELAPLLEDAGFESFWVGDHSHIPTSRRTPAQGGGELPEYYKQLLDPFVMLATAAAITKTLRVGTNICIIAQRDPIQLAKEVASLDVLSGGRFSLGVGTGWNLEEMENHGTDPDTRFRAMHERIEAMKEIWTKDVAEYHGSIVSYESLWAYPKPVQKPHPPILMGAMGPNALKRVVKYADAWLPVHLLGRTPPGYLEPVSRIPELQRLAAEAGREVSVTLSVPAVIDAAEVERLTEAGVERLIFWLPLGGEDVVAPMIEQLAPLIAQFS